MFVNVRILDNGYIKVGNKTWHRESRVEEGGPFAPEFVETLPEAASRAIGDDAAILETSNGKAVAIHLLHSRRAEQEKRLGYWEVCYGEYAHILWEEYPHV